MAHYPTETELAAGLSELRQKNKTVFRLPGIIDERLNLLSGFLYRLLSYHDSAYLSEMLLVVLREITGNCSRATAKRLYFKVKGLDITKEADYKTGMPEFRDVIQKNWSDFIKQNKQSDFYINIEFTLSEDYLQIEIKNNISLLEIEKQRIMHRLQSFHKFESISEAFNSISDTSEGAGLGLFFLLSLLKNSNIPIKNFKILPRKDHTLHQLQIPFRPTAPAFQNDFYKKILAEIDALPTFPDNINRLLQLCDSPKSSIEEITDQVQHDPSLTTQVLRLVNSAGYMTRNRNPGLIDAIKIIGLRGLRDLLMVSGARQAIVDHYRIKEIENLWEQANMVSCFARRLAQSKGARTAEQATIAGLLCILGRIVLLALKPRDLESVSQMLGNKRVRSEAILEEIVIGISNAEIGSRMAEKWQLPESLQISIRYQFNPLRAPQEYQDLVESVYLGKCMLQYLNGSITWWHIESEVLSRFGFESENDWQKRAQSWKTDCQDYKNISA